MVLATCYFVLSSSRLLDISFLKIQLMRPFENRYSKIKILGYKNHRNIENTLKGSRTPAACLEGKHDNRFTISVHINSKGLNLHMSPRSFLYSLYKL